MPQTNSTYEQAIAKGQEYMALHMKPSRRAHTENVVKTARELSERFGADPLKAEVAAWFHDLVRNLDDGELNGYIDAFGIDPRYKNNRNLSHGRIAAALMKRDFGIDDEDILQAVIYHTTGRRGMSPLEKVIFLADVIEPGRTHPSADETRKLAESDLDRACLFALEQTIAYVAARGEPLDKDTEEARADLAEKTGEVNV